jgi:CRISPR-associated protein Cmr2
MPRYIALSIGPIYGTISKARRTRELWAASYLFSHFMRRIITALESDASLKGKYAILIPIINAPNGPTGVGLYPDMLIMRADDIKLQDVLEVTDTVRQALAKALANDVLTLTCTDKGTSLETIKKKRQNDIEKYFLDLLQVVAMEATEDQLKQLTNTKGLTAITKGLQKLIAQLELRPILAHSDPDIMKALLSLANDKQGVLRKEAFSAQLDRFPSLPEIATQELRMLSDEKNEKYNELVDEDFDKLIGKEARQEQSNPEQELHDRLAATDAFPDDLFKYHRSAAYVQADGDHIGKVIAQLNSEDDLKAFSKTLAVFARKANEAMAGKRFTHGDDKDHGWGAVPVYIGGDDLLMLAPVASRSSVGSSQLETIFDLVKQVDDLFKATVTNWVHEKNLKVEHLPSLSFGIAVHYMKSPMREANQGAHDLLMHVKDKKYSARDRFHLRIYKHSGSSFGAVYYKGGPAINFKYTQKDGGKHVENAPKKNAWQIACWLVKRYATPIPKQDRAASATAPFLNSLIAHVRENKQVIAAIAEDPERVKAWLDNNFNEPHHGKLQDILWYVAQYIAAGFKQAEHLHEKELENKAAMNSFMDELHTTLRFIQFIRGHDKD